jgi:hypothetical protein
MRDDGTLWLAPRSGYERPLQSEQAGFVVANVSSQRAVRSSQ